MAAVLEPFKIAEQQRAAARFGMWLFLATEVLFFGGMFMAYAVYRFMDPAAFQIAAAHTKVVIGTCNATILIISSLTMGLAISAAEREERDRVVLFLAMTVVLGLLFLAFKGFEYHQDIDEGLTPGHGFALRPPSTELFFSLYWAMTFVHALHMTVGIGVLTTIIVLLRRHGLTPAGATRVETAGLYWHFVDVIWIFLYPLLYLQGRGG